mmetsp:Transcript_30209/g.46195  ORF Transcript_30209/g.46195 Transcript_30209/m.46195 type:complete len:128 (-) Transcript_30209:543-926(-)
MILESIMKQVIGIKPANVVSAIDGREGYQRAIEQKFDLIIMDLNMPIMDGVEATKKIRADVTDDADDILGASPFILALSGCEFNQSLRQLCMEAGFNDTVTTPLKADDLQTRVIDLILIKEHIRAAT